MFCSPKFLQRFLYFFASFKREPKGNREVYAIRLRKTCYSFSSINIWDQRVSGLIIFSIPFLSFLFLYLSRISSTVDEEDQGACAQSLCGKPPWGYPGWHTTLFGDSTRDCPPLSPTITPPCVW